jgi:hypothetical protein
VAQAIDENRPFDDDRIFLRGGTTYRRLPSRLLDRSAACAEAAAAVLARASLTAIRDSFSPTKETDGDDCRYRAGH